MGIESIQFGKRSEAKFASRSQKSSAFERIENREVFVRSGSGSIERQRLSELGGRESRSHCAFSS